MKIGHLKIRLLFAFVALMSLLCLWDMVRFVRTVQSYALAAAKGIIIEPLPVQHEAVVVLTGDKGRIPRALELTRSRGVPLLVISGTGKGTTLTDLVNQQKDAAVNIHQVWDRIKIESQSSSTVENALEAEKILKTRGVTRVILVTSDYHMHRSLILFRRLLPHYEYVPFPVISGFTDLFPFPTEQALVAAWRTWLEYWKLILVRAHLV